MVPCGRKSNVKRGSANQIPCLKSGADPSFGAGASSPLPKDDWIECSKCKKWRLICVRDVKAESLPLNWECRSMTWLPSFNSCKFSEETTTTAGYALLGVPSNNINFGVLSGKKYEHVAKPPVAPTNASSRRLAVALGNSKQEGKCSPKDVGRDHKENGGLLERRTKVEAAKTERIPRLKVITDKPGCSKARSLTSTPQSCLTTTLEARTGETVSAGQHQQHAKARAEGAHGTSEARGSERKRQEADDHDVPARKRIKEGPGFIAPTEERIPQFPVVEVPTKQENENGADVAASQNATEVPTKDWVSEAVEVPTEERRHHLTNRDIEMNNSFRKQADFWLMNASMEVTALIKAAEECQKRMPLTEDETPSADLHLQASLKHLQITRHQELVCGKSPEANMREETTGSDIPCIQNYMDAAKMFDHCTKMYENIPDHAKAALCHILSGVARMRLLAVVMQLHPLADEHSCQGKEYGETCKQIVGGCSTRSLQDHSSSLLSACNSFLQNTANISPMLDSWIKARNCVALAEAIQGDPKYLRAMLEVRKVCGLAMFDHYEHMINQVYVAMEALNT